MKRSAAMRRPDDRRTRVAPGAKAIGLGAAIVACTLLLAPVPAALAESPPPPGFPERPVKIIVGQTPGSTADNVARIAADALSTHWGQSVVVENHSGAGGTIAADLVAAAPADGYTLLLGGVSNLVAIAASGDRNLRYDPLTDFTPLGRIARTPFFVVARGDLPAKTMPELFALARAAPGRLTYVSYGAGTLSRAAFDLLASAAGIELTEVPYRGAAMAQADLLAGRVDVGLFEYANARQNAEAGRVRLLAAIGARRSSAAPDIPTVAEQGLPGFAVEAWYGLVAPDGLPPGVERRLAQALHEARRGPEMRRRIALLSYESIDDDPAQFAAAIRADIERYRRAAEQKTRAAASAGNGASAVRATPPPAR